MKYRDYAKQERNITDEQLEDEIHFCPNDIHKDFIDLCENGMGDCKKCWDQEMPDTVNHPNHYNREGAMECLDEMLLLFGRQAVMDFCRLNAWKYRYRAADKNGEEDLKKSDWYLKKYKELGGEEHEKID